MRVCLPFSDCSDHKGGNIGMGKLRHCKFNEIQREALGRNNLKLLTKNTPFPIMTITLIVGTHFSEAFA